MSIDLLDQEEKTTDSTKNLGHSTFQKIILDKTHFVSRGGAMRASRRPARTLEKTK